MGAIAYPGGQVVYEETMGALGWLVTGLVVAWQGPTAQNLGGTFQGDLCKVEGKLPGDLQVRVVVEMGPARRPTEEEMKAMGRERFSSDFRGP